MSIYGALYSGVSGLKAQSTKIAVISDNISNVNTVGYKGGQGQFRSLVVSSGSGSSYSPGGVLGGNRQQVSKQGLLQTTDSPTDIAISGEGFFVVNGSSDGTGNVFFTRAGAFRPDERGNFKNAAGFFLQAWPLDREGRLPGDPGNENTVSSANLSSLLTVNVQNLTGVAASTTTVRMSANLNASQAIFAGAGATGEMDNSHSINFGDNLKGKSLIVPGGSNLVRRGDEFAISNGDNSLSYAYRYGGFTYSRDVDALSPVNGDSDVALLDAQTTLTTASTNLGNNPVLTGAIGTGTVTITTVAAHDLQVGDVVTLAALNATDGITAPQLNTTHVITAVTSTTFTVVTAGSSSVGGQTGGGNNPGTWAAQEFATTNLSNVVRVRHADHGLEDGAVVDISGVTGTLNNIPATDFNNQFVIDVIDDNHYDIVVATDANATGGGGGGTIIASTRPFVGNILDASNVTAPFLGTTGISNFTSAALSFNITTATAGTVTFTYTAASPNSQLGQFNNLTNLATSINNVDGLSARVDGGILYVGATDANEAISFANGSTIGTDGPPVQAGINWVRELGLDDLVVGTNRFSTLNGLADLINGTSTGFTAVVNNPLSSASITINIDDPQDTIVFDDKADDSAETLATATPFTTVSGSNVVIVNHDDHGLEDKDFVTLSLLAGGPFNGIAAADLDGEFEITVIDSNHYSIISAGTATASGDTGAANLDVTPPNNNGSLLGELGFADTLIGSYAPQTLGPLGPSYNPDDADNNMASGVIAPQFSRPVRVFDSLGAGHDINISFLKIAPSTWAIEIFAIPASDVTTANGLITSGQLTFDGSGALQSVSSTLSDEVDIVWAGDSDSSTITFNWGTTGLSDGLGQFATAFKVNFVDQNGAPVGELTSVAINEDGFIIASYSNGETQDLFRIPIADFANADELQGVSGNVFSQTSASGEVNLVQAGTSGVGKIASSSLEQSNVELADQLTDMIVAQRAYQANTKIISTADSLLEELNRILQ